MKRKKVTRVKRDVDVVPALARASKQRQDSARNTLIRTLLGFPMFTEPFWLSALEDILRDNEAVGSPLGREGYDALRELHLRLPPVLKALAKARKHFGVRVIKRP